MPGPIVTVFRSRLDPAHVDEYTSVATRMNELVRTMPGFVESKSFTADDGERVTIVVFADAESEAAWRDHSEHRAAQRSGIERFYTEYSISVGEAHYSSMFSR